MSSDPTAWIPIYIGDYMGDTARLTCEQHGAYLLLIFDYWRNGPPPDDDAVLQQIVKQDRATWKRTRAVLEPKFQLEGGVWRHKRIEAELKAAHANQDRRSNKAKAAAQARWGKSSDDAPRNARSNARSIPPSNARGHASECPPPSPIGEAKASPLSRASTAPGDPLERRVMHAAGFTRPLSQADRRQIATWQDDGIDIDEDVIPILSRLRDREHDRGRTIGSLGYADIPVREQQAKDREQLEHYREVRQRYGGAQG